MIIMIKGHNNYETYGGIELKCKSFFDMIIFILFFKNFIIVI